MLRELHACDLDVAGLWVPVVEELRVPVADELHSRQQEGRRRARGATNNSKVGLLRLRTSKTMFMSPSVCPSVYPCKFHMIRLSVQLPHDPSLRAASVHAKRERKERANKQAYCKEGGGDPPDPPGGSGGCYCSCWKRRSPWAQKWIVM